MPKVVAERADWIKLGYKLFAMEGDKGIVVEKMAAKLKCNKSSFYWHFGSKKQFIDEIIQYWIDTQTSEIIERVDAETSLKKKYDRFVELTFQHDPFIDFNFFLKRYGKRHKHVQKIFDEIDSRRVEYTANFLTTIGYHKKEAKVKAEIIYKYLIGYHEMTRYKGRTKNYVAEVQKDLAHFVKIQEG